MAQIGQDATVVAGDRVRTPWPGDIPGIQLGSRPIWAYLGLFGRIWAAPPGALSKTNPLHVATCAALSVLLRPGFANVRAGTEHGADHRRQLIELVCHERTE